METSLHRQLKTRYAGPAGQIEVACGGFRIDAVNGRELVEIQHASLAAIRAKIARLLEAHRVRVVKPLVDRRQLVYLDRPGGTVLRRRRSPKRGQLIELFDELVYFVEVFPHRRLALELLVVDIEEWRCEGHGRRRRRRRDDFEVIDQRLVAVSQSRVLRRPGDLAALLPETLPDVFDTAQLAEALGVSRFTAQRIAYCLRQTRAAETVGKRRGAWLYRLPARAA